MVPRGCYQRRGADVFPESCSKGHLWGYKIFSVTPCVASICIRLFELQVTEIALVSVPLMHTVCGINPLQTVAPRGCVSPLCKIEAGGSWDVDSQRQLALIDQKIDLELNASWLNSVMKCMLRTSSPDYRVCYDELKLQRKIVIIKIRMLRRMDEIHIYSSFAAFSF